MYFAVMKMVAAKYIRFLYDLFIVFYFIISLSIKILQQNGHSPLLNCTENSQNIS